MIDGFRDPTLVGEMVSKVPYELETAFPRRRPAIQSYKVVDKYISFLHLKVAARDVRGIGELFVEGLLS